MATGSRGRRPFLTPPGGDRGPFSLPSLSDAYGWGGYEQERDIYLRAVPNATDDQLETGVGVWSRLSETLGDRSLEDQARIVLAFPFVSQDLVLAGGVGPETRRVTERYPAVTLEELRDTIGAAAGEIRRGTAGIHSRRASAAEAREAIRDMKGATLAALERIQDEDSDAAAAYLEALRASAREIRTGKATKAELAAVARLIGAALPSDVDSWSQVKKARLKDLLEEHLEAEVNPPRPWTAEFRRPWSPRDPDYFPYEHRTSYKYGARPGYPQMSGLWSDVVVFDLEAPITKKEKEALEEVLEFFREQESMGWKKRTFKPNTGHGVGFHYRVFRSLVGKGFLDHAPEGYDEGRPDWNYTDMEYDTGGLIPGQRKLPQEAEQFRLFNPCAGLDDLDLERVG